MCLFQFVDLDLSIVFIQAVKRVDESPDFVVAVEFDSSTTLFYLDGGNSPGCHQMTNLMMAQQMPRKPAMADPMREMVFMGMFLCCGLVVGGDGGDRTLDRRLKRPLLLPAELHPPFFVEWVSHVYAGETTATHHDLAKGR